jgi:hypothetical protein
MDKTDIERARRFVAKLFNRKEKEAWAKVEEEERRDDEKRARVP